MKQLILIRHGLPHEGHPIRPHDPPLHDDGHRQAQHLAQMLVAERIDRIVCSPQQRARDTAAPLVALTGLPLEIYDGLAEIDRLMPRYRSAETIRAEGPERWAEFVASPAKFMGLDPLAYRESVVTALSDIANHPQGTRVAVFSHGMTIKTMICAVLGLNDNGYSLFSTAHCSVSRLVSMDNSVAASSSNATSRTSGLVAPRMKVESVNESLIGPRGEQH
jgi:2,3-bisphosphoglycerate-dependent phosphoglycerate mutase